MGYFLTGLKVKQPDCLRKFGGLLGKFFFHGLSNSTEQGFLFLFVKICKQLPQPDQQENSRYNPGPASFFNLFIFLFYHRYALIQLIYG